MMFTEVLADALRLYFSPLRYPVRLYRELRQRKLEVEAAAQDRMRREMAEGEDGNT